MSTNQTLPARGMAGRLESLIGLREAQKGLCRRLRVYLDSPEQIDNEIAALIASIQKAQARLDYLYPFKTDLKERYISSCEHLDEINKQIKLEESSSTLLQLKALQEQIAALRAQGVNVECLQKQLTATPVIVKELVVPPIKTDDYCAGCNQVLQVYARGQADGAPFCVSCAKTMEEMGAKLVQC